MASVETGGPDGGPVQIGEAVASGGEWLAALGGGEQAAGVVSGKTQAALELVHRCLDRGEPVTVISARVGQTDELFIRIVNAIGADKVARIDATITPNQHAAEADRFKKGAARALFMGIKCAKAYSFPRCPNAIILSLEYSFGSLEQARGRVWRVNSAGSIWPGEDRPTVRIWCILHRNSIEETMFDVVATKQDAATICLHGRRVPRDYKPRDLEEVLAESLFRKALADPKALERLQAAIEGGGGDVPVAAEDPHAESTLVKVWPRLREVIIATQRTPAWLKRKVHGRRTNRPSVRT